MTSTNSYQQSLNIGGIAMIIDVSDKLLPELPCIADQVDMDYRGIGFNSDDLIIYFVRHLFEENETIYNLN